MVDIVVRDFRVLYRYVNPEHTDPGEIRDEAFKVLVRSKTKRGLYPLESRGLHGVAAKPSLVGSVYKLQDGLREVQIQFDIAKFRVDWTDNEEFAWQTLTRSFHPTALTYLGSEEKYQVLALGFKREEK